MAKMIQIRNVPAALHAELVRRARRRGMTLTAYLESVLRREVARPDAEEAVARVKELEELDVTGITGAGLVREARRDAGR